MLGVLYAEKCKSAYDGISSTVQVLAGLRRDVRRYLAARDNGAAAGSQEGSQGSQAGKVVRVGGEVQPPETPLRPLQREDDSDPKRTLGIACQGWT